MSQPRSDVPTLRYPLYALTTSELKERRSALERAMGQVSPGGSVPQDLQAEVDRVIAEQEQRARILRGIRGSYDPDYYSVRQLSTAELERTKRELKANLSVTRTDSPALVPIVNHLRAVDAELAIRAGNGQICGQAR
jgi:hypothetical protein